jgi:PAS domain S-box-containing protein
VEGLASRDDVAELAGLRARVDELAARDEVAELAARLDELAQLRDRFDAGAGDLAELRGRLDGLATRDELATLADHDEVVELAARLESLAARDDIAELRSRLDGVAARDELAELRARLDGLTGFDAAVTRDELTARLEGLASDEDLAALRDRLNAREDVGVAQQALSAAEDALDRIALVDRGAGSVLADVRALRSTVDEAISLAQGAQESGRQDSEELRELIARLGGELEVSKREAHGAETEALGARQVAAAAGEAATAARDDAARAREESASTRRDLDAHSERTAVQLESVRAEARNVGEGLVERLAAADHLAGALKSELGASRERLDAVGSHVDRLGTTVSETAGLVDTERRAGEQRTAALRAELSEVRHVAETAARGLEFLRAELAGAREAAEAARAAANQGDERIIALQSEVSFALKGIDELKQGLSSAGQAAVIARREAESARKAAQHVGDGSTERVTEVFQQILGLAAARNQPARRGPTVSSPATKPEPVKREPRHGFDDAVQPMAILALDGKFKELNPAFTKLVGYKEHEFTKAAWPSPHDRRDYKEQLEQLRQMGIGELREAEVQSTYMHGQGLMVPVVGRLSLATAEDWTPQHLLLVAEDRHTT